jgi:hypothetical protein
MSSDLTDLTDLPPELEGAASDLGRFHAEYRAGWGLLLYMLLGLVLLVLGLVLTAGIVFLAADDRNFHAGYIKLVILSIGLTIGGLFMTIRSAGAWGSRVLVFERCLVHLKRGRMRVFGWHEITAFEQKTTKGFWEKMIQSSYWMKLRRHDGEALRIDAYLHRAQDLGARVEQELARRNEG